MPPPHHEGYSTRDDVLAYLRAQEPVKMARSRRLNAFRGATSA